MAFADAIFDGRTTLDGVEAIRVDELDAASAVLARYTVVPVGAGDVRQPVVGGEVIARIDGKALTAPLSGVLRGPTHDGVRVAAGTRVIEIDPRGDPALVRGIGERPARMADGVLRAIDVVA
jgi:hypothetical protein